MYTSNFGVLSARRLIMTINATSPLAGALLTGSFQTAAGATTVSGGNFSPTSAFLLGGSTPDFASGGYNAQGLAIGTGTTQATSDPAAKHRAEQLRTAAEKIDAGDTAGGRAIAEKLLDRNASDLTALSLVAHSHLAERDYGQAEKFLSRALALAPSSVRLRGDLANVRTLQKSDDDVLTDARRQLKDPTQRSNGLRLLLYLSDRSPDNVDAYLALAEGFDVANQPLQVIGALQEAVRIAGPDRITDVITPAAKLVNDHPDVGLPRNILGRALQKAGRFDEAIVALRGASEIAPDNDAYRQDLASGYGARAIDAVGRGNISSAQADLRKGRSLDPINKDLSDAAAHIAAKRAEKFVAAGLHKKAYGELATANSRAPDDEAFRLKLAKLYARVGAYFRDREGTSLALSSFTKSLELDPSSATVRRNVAVLSHEKGLSALSAKNYDSAITHLDRARTTNSLNSLYRQDLARAYDARGQLSLSLGKVNDAIADFKKGFALDPTNTTLDTNLSSALAQNGGS